MPNPNSENNAVQRYFDSEPRTERRVSDRRHDTERPAQCSTTGYLMEMERRIEIMMADAQRGQMIVHQELAICLALKCCLEEIAQLKQEVAAIRAEIG